MIREFHGILATSLCGIAWLASSLPIMAETPANAKAKPGYGSPVTIAVVGNKLIVHSDDREALECINQLARVLMDSNLTEGDYRLFPIKAGVAVELAEQIKKAFPKSQVKCVVDPTCNLLMVRAGAADMLAISAFLANTLEPRSAEMSTAPRSVVIGPLKYNYAGDVLNLLKDLYAANLVPPGASPPGSPGAAPPGADAPPPKPAPKTAEELLKAKRAITGLSLDERTNTIIVTAQPALIQEIKSLIDQLEKSIAETKAVSKFAPTLGVDPNVLLQVIEVMKRK